MRRIKLFEDFEGKESKLGDMIEAAVDGWSDEKFEEAWEELVKNPHVKDEIMHNKGESAKDALVDYLKKELFPPSAFVQKWFPDEIKKAGLNEKAGSEYPEDSTEYKVHKVLQPLIDELKKKIFTPEYREKATDEETLGIIVSKYCEWDVNKIKEVIDACKEDANIRESIRTTDEGERATEMANVIYDTLMKNTQHEQLDFDKVENPYIGGNNIYFTYNRLQYKLTVTAEEE